MRRIFPSFLLTLIWLLAPALPVAGASITVNASCSLPDAITAANTDTATGGCITGTAGSDTITITEAGTTDGTITLSAELAVNGTSSQDSVIVLVGGGYTVSGNDSVRVFKVQQYGNLSISSLTITNGSAGNGGGVHVDAGGILTLSSVVIKDSEATSGTGGGLKNLGTLTMSSSGVHSNSSSSHGGGLELRGTVNITGSIIRNNTTAGGQYGGGVYVTGNSQNISIQTSSIYSNSTGNGFGGGIFVGSARPFVLKNSSIYNNRATSGGGGLYHNSGQTNLTHVTIAFNRSNFVGAGVTRNTGTLRLRNSIISGNTRSDGSTRRHDCSGTIGEMTNTLIQDGGCSATYSGDPKLASATAGSPPYYALLDDSPAIGVGNDTYCAEVGTDQRGETRPATGCDIGAFENSLSAPIELDTATPTPTNTPTSTNAPVHTDTPEHTDTPDPNATDTPEPPATDTPEPTATPTTALESERFEPATPHSLAAVSANGRARAPRAPSATLTQGPSTGEILTDQGYQLAATHGLDSGVQYQRVDAGRHARAGHEWAGHADGQRCAGGAVRLHD